MDRHAPYSIARLTVDQHGYRQGRPNALGEWLAAMKKRGLDPLRLRALLLSAGAFGHENEIGKRVARDLGFC